MQNFSIRELRAKGQGKRDGVIEFEDGLNFIFGRSDTGKTWILKSINYLFGSSALPFPSVTGYTSVEGIFETARYGRIKIKRDVGSKTAMVIAESPDIDDGEYSTDYRKNASNYLNDLWLQIIGIDEKVEVPKNNRYERERLSWANIASVFFTDEDEIDSTDSIITKNVLTATALISSLYYILTDDYKKGVDKVLSPKERKASKNAVTSYIDSQIESLENQRMQTASALDQLGAMDVEEKMAELSSEIEFAQEETQGLLEQNSIIAGRIFELQQRRIDIQVLIDRYDALLSQYKADLQRMGFIYEGETAIKSQQRNEHCPFCGGDVNTIDEDNLGAIEAEAKRIASEITVIVATRSEVLDEKAEIEESMKSLAGKGLEVQGMLETRNQEIAKLEADLDRFAEHASLSSRLEYIEQSVHSLGEKRAQVNKRQPAPTEYKAKEEFEALIGSDFDDILNKILETCNFTSGYASWDFSKFDVDINGVAKAVNSGKGYRSFLNSVVSLMLYSYFNSGKAKYKPGFMMIDTPLLGFDEDESLASSPHLKNGLYEYLMRNPGGGQIIVVDNIGTRPDLDFAGMGAKVTVYKKDEADEATYGFLPDWRKVLSKGEK